MPASAKSIILIRPSTNLCAAPAARHSPLKRLSGVSKSGCPTPVSIYAVKDGVYNTKNIFGDDFTCKGGFCAEFF